MTLVLTGLASSEAYAESTVPGPSGIETMSGRSNAFNSVAIISEHELDEMRGGTINIAGFAFDLGFKLTTSANNAIVAQTMATLGQLAAGGIGQTVFGPDLTAIHQIAPGGITSTVIINANGLEVSNLLDVTLNVLNFSELVGPMRSSLLSAHLGTRAGGSM